MTRSRKSLCRMVKRYELKYVVPHVTAGQVIARILMHPASFRKAFPDRRVNNIYYDTPGFHCFYQNINGDPRRDKVRLRWYGESNLPTPESILEIKHKDRELGWKTSIPVRGDTVVNEASAKAVLTAINRHGNELEPVLKNSYLRSYFVSFDGLFRITVDRAQRFAKPFDSQQLIPESYPVVVELKFDADKMQRARAITDYIPFRQSKNSKYVTGIEALYML